MGYETILTDFEDGVLTLTLNRPEKLNAWTHQMGNELTEAIRHGNEDDGVDAFLEKREPDFKRVRRERA